MIGMTRLTTTRRHAFAAFCAAGLLLTAGAAPLAAQTMTKLRVGKAISVAFSFVPLDVGIQTGIFKKHGIEIDEYSFGGSSKLQQAMAAGSIDIGLGSGPELAFIAKGAPVMGVAALANEPSLLVLEVQKDGPIRTVADLKGKTVSVSTVGSLTEWMAHELSRQQGWGTQGIKTIGLGTDASQTSALITHQVDGNVVDVGTAYRMEAQGASRILVRFGDMVKDFHIHVIFGHRDLLAKNPDALSRFLAAWFETIAYMRQNKAKSVEIGARVMSVTPEMTSRIYDEIMPMFSADGKFRPKALDVLKRSYVEMGVLPSEPDMSKLINEKYLPAAAR